MLFYGSENYQEGDRTMLEAPTRMTAWDSRSPYRSLDRRQTQVVTYERVKRGFDFSLALFLLVLLLPLLVLTAIAIKLDSHGPVLFVQRRTGRYGRPFNFFKFRSMCYDEDHVAAHREFVRQYANGDHGNGNDNGVNKPQSNGRVITRVGRWLRLTSLDELPQLWNILRGDMSFVGPRAWADYELENYKDWHYRRLQVPPGLTGLAQINGRSSLSFDTIIRLDIEYIEYRSLTQDLSILLRTLPVVIGGQNAG